MHVGLGGVQTLDCLEADDVTCICADVNDVCWCCD